MCVNRTELNGPLNTSNTQGLWRSHSRLKMHRHLGYPPTRRQGEVVLTQVPATDPIGTFKHSILRWAAKSTIPAIIPTYINGQDPSTSDYHRLPPWLEDPTWSLHLFPPKFDLILQPSDWVEASHWQVQPVTQWFSTWRARRNFIRKWKNHLQNLSLEQDEIRRYYFEIGWLREFDATKLHQS